jgi:transposase InsO family protein
VGYQRTLDAYGINCSTSRRGNCHDNAVMEASFSSVKSETADRFASFGDAKRFGKAMNANCFRRAHYPAREPSTLLLTSLNE